MFDKPVEIYDIEVAPDFFSYTGISGTVDINYVSKLVRDNYGKSYIDILNENDILFTQFVIRKGRNQFKELIKYFDRDIIFVGFNNHDYDDVIIRYLLLIVKYKLNIPPIVQGKKMYLKNSKGLTSTKAYPLFRGDKIKSTNDLLYCIYMMSQHIVNTPFAEKSKDKLSQAIKRIKVKFISIDLFSIMEQNERKALKMLAIMYKWWRIQDLPYKFDDHITDDMVEPVLEYNLNDVLITALSYYIRKKDINLRKGMMVKYNHGFNIISKNKSELASLFIETDYAKLAKQDVYQFKQLRTDRPFVNLSECISKRIVFEDSILIDIDEMVFKGKGKIKVSLFKQCTLTTFLNYIRSLQIRNTFEIDYILYFKEVTFNFKSGGLHSNDTPKVFKSIEGKLYYKDFDFGSYYPGFVISEHVAPAHLDAEAFHILAKTYTGDRLAFKSLLKVYDYGTQEYEDANTGASTLKIVINAGLFGKFGSEHSFLYDPKALLTVTINGQFILLMLAERYTHAGLKVINANTDGLICEIREDQLEEYYRIGKEFSELVDIPYEYTDYATYACKNVNNYIAVKHGAEKSDYATAIADGKIKQKGEFVDQIDPAKGYKYPIVPYAVNKYLIEGIPIEDTILNHCKINPDNIMDFCFAQKINANDFNMELIEPNGNRVKLQKNVRAYLGTKRTEKALYGQLFKAYINPPVSETNNKSGVKVSLKKGSYFMEKRQCTLFNDWFPVKDASEYNIDYQYYISKAKETITIIEKGIFAKTPSQTAKKLRNAISNESQLNLWGE